MQQVRQAPRMGMLGPGDQLPTAQQVVARLAINPNTVHKAYRELEREGLARARPGLGTFITGSLSGTDPATQARLLAGLAGWLRSARSAGLVRASEPVWDPGWAVTTVSLEELVIACMNPAYGVPARGRRLAVAS